MSLATVFAQLETLNESSEIYRRKPLAPAELETFASLVQSRFSFELPDSYLEFLAHTDGIQIGNASICSTSNFIESNEVFRAGLTQKENWIYLGSAGNIDVFFYDITLKEFVVAEYFSLEKLNSGPDMSVILTNILETELSNSSQN